MKSYIYAAGSLALALAMSGIPAALAHAETGGGDGSVMRSVGATTTGLRVQMPREETQEGAGARAQERDQLQASSTDTASSTIRTREMETLQNRDQRLASSSEGEQGNATSTMMRERVNEMLQTRIELQLEASTTPARTVAQLQQMIQQREQELSQEAASTTPHDQEIVKNANQVRLAVHALLASKDLLGGIGQQVSTVAQQINQSVATTTNAEAQIQSRGFWSKLLWGGDTNAADILKQSTDQNQGRIQELTQLLGQASSTPEVQASLQVQLTAMQQEQARLQSVANQQASLWGLFSWRF